MTVYDSTVKCFAQLPSPPPLCGLTVLQTEHEQTVAGRLRCRVVEQAAAVEARVVRTRPQAWRDGGVVGREVTRAAALQR